MLSMKIRGVLSLPISQARRQVCHANIATRFFRRAAWREGFVLDFCSTFRIGFYVMFRKNLRSPFIKQLTVLFCSLRSNPCLYSQQSKNGTPIGVPSCFGGERGIRSWILQSISDWILSYALQNSSVTVHKTTHGVVLFTAFESLFVFSRKSKKASSKEDAFLLFGGERGIRTLVCVSTNWFRDLSIIWKMQNFDGIYECFLEGIFDSLIET